MIPEGHSLSHIPKITGPNTLSEMVILNMLMETPKQREAYRLLTSIFWEETALFLAVMEGRRFSIPSRQKIESLLLQSRLWLYIQQRGNSPETIEQAAKLFGRGQKEIHRIYNRVERLIQERLTEVPHRPPLGMEDSLFDSLPLFGNGEDEDE